MYLVFLDFDGVLASQRVHLAGGAAYSDSYVFWSKFDPVAVDFINRIHDTYCDVRSVTMSAWKKTADGKDDYSSHAFQPMLRLPRSAGHPWKTNPRNDPLLERGDRAYVVSDYPARLAPVGEDFNLFDDNSFRFKEVLGKGRHVHTSEIGELLPKHMLDALSIAGH